MTPLPSKGNVARQSIFLSIEMFWWKTMQSIDHNLKNSLSIFRRPKILESHVEENIAFEKNIFEKFLKKILTQ